MASMKGTSRIREMCDLVTKDLEYSSSKKDAHSIVVLEHDILPYFLLGMVKVFVMPINLSSMFDKILGSTESVVIVVWPLTSIMKDQTPSRIAIDNDAISYIVQ